MVRNLEKHLGLPSELGEDFRLTFGHNVAMDGTNVRDFSSLRVFLKDPFCTYYRRDAYWTYQNVAKDKDLEKIFQAGISFDITVLPPGVMGGEFARTAGHYNNSPFFGSSAYPEIVEVVHGRAFLFMQLTSNNYEVLERVMIMDMGAGDKAMVPPDYGYVLINLSEEPLVVTRLASKRRISIREPFEARGGPAFYVMVSQKLQSDGSSVQNYNLLPNNSYKSLPEPYWVRGTDQPRFQIYSSVPVYLSALRDLNSLAVLNDPNSHLDELEPDRLFKAMQFSETY